MISKVTIIRLPSAHLSNVYGLLNDIMTNSRYIQGAQATGTPSYEVEQRAMKIEKCANAIHDILYNHVDYGKDRRSK